MSAIKPLALSIVLVVAGLLTFLPSSRRAAAEPKAQVLSSDAVNEQELQQLLDTVLRSRRFAESKLAMHRLTEIDSDGGKVLPIAAKWLLSDDWPVVYTAYYLFLFYQERSVPYLLEAMKKREWVRLTNTEDLIYPGAEKFYGHGRIVNYELDYIPGRVGWVVEGLTFRIFGFRSAAIDEDRLLQARGEGLVDIPLGDIQDVRRGKSADIDLACRRVARWWRNAQFEWNRYRGLLEALDSNCAERQATAIQHIRFGSDPCDELDETTFDRDIIPRLERLLSSDNDAVRWQAELLLGDDEKMWWQAKDRKALQSLFDELYSAEEVQE